MRDARYPPFMDDEGGREVADALGLLLRRTTRSRIYTALTADLGEAVDETTYPVLSGLARTGPRSAADLAPDVGVDRSVVTRRASRLEKAGLIRREQDTADQRATLLVLTSRGEEVVDELRRRLAARISESLSGWPPEEARIFARYFHRFATGDLFT